MIRQFLQLCLRQRFKKRLLVFSALVTSFFMFAFGKTLFSFTNQPKNKNDYPISTHLANYQHVPNPDGYPLPDYYKSPTPGYALGNVTKDVDILIGITSVKRSQGDYLMKTIRSLITNLGSKQTSVAFVVYFGEYDTSYVKNRSEEIVRRFSNLTSSSAIQVVSPPNGYYPDWQTSLVENFGDTYERIKWRSKQNLDQIWLMMYAYQFTPSYYLMMEDDVIASKSYDDKITQVITSVNNKEWVVLSFCKLGAIGQLFRAETLPAFASFIHTFWNKKPLDWLLEDFISTAYCSHDESPTVCQEILKLRRHLVSPSLFQHMGKFSSLKGKIQHLKDKSFKAS